MSTYTPKGWLDYPNLTTPTDADAWKAMEQRVVSYAASEAISPGVAGYEDFRPKQDPAGASMRVGLGSVSTEMMAWVRDSVAGVYRYEYNGAQLYATIGTADGSNPRIDRVCLTAPASIDSIVPQVVVLAGTPTSGATLDNLTGAQAIPTGYLLLADVVVGAGVGNIVTANIRDRRAVGGIMGQSGILPPPMPTAGTGRDEVIFLPSDDLPQLSVTLTPTTHDNYQGAYLATLSRRIVGATRLRFRYAQGATPATSNYNVAILDTSGRLIVAVGATAFAGGASTIQEIALTIAATTFDAGDYFVWMGVAALTASSAVSFYGIQGNGTVTAPGPAHRNQKFSLNSGGTTFPAVNQIGTTYADVVASAAAYTALPMPIFSASVG